MLLQVQQERTSKCTQHADRVQQESAHQQRLHSGETSIITRIHGLHCDSSSCLTNCRKQPKDVFKVESCVCFCWIPTQSCSYVCYPSQDKPPFGSSHHHNSNGAMGVHNRWFRGGKIRPFQSSKKRDIPFMFLAYSNGDRKCQKLLLLGKTVSKQRRKAVQVNPSGCNQNHHFTQWMSNNQNFHGQDRLLIFPDSSQSTWNQSYPNHFSEGTGPNTQITAFILHWFLHHRQAVQLPFSFSHCFAWIAKITATV